MLLLTDDGVIAARDKWGRTPVVLGRKEGAWAATMESCALHNLGYTIDRQLGPGEVVRLTPAGPEQLVPPGNELQICSFLWIYYATRLPSTYAKLEKNGEAHLADYANADTDRYAAMVEQIRQQIGLTTLQYQRLDDMVEAIGMPADKVCTYCSGLTQTNGVAFDNDRCLAEQSQAIRERIDSFGGKLYLEFGGKLLFDYHASRVLPGFDRRGTRRVCAASA
jgi:glutamine phosphoribosylpyrophosphate amidotransferase